MIQVNRIDFRGVFFTRSLWDFGEFLHIHAKNPQVQSDTKCPRLLAACCASPWGIDKNLLFPVKFPYEREICNDRPGNTAVISRGLAEMAA
jgi:hypothetical protein